MRRAAVRHAGVALSIVAIWITGCVSLTAPWRDGEEPGEYPGLSVREATVANGFVSVRLMIPPGASAPLPVVINPVVLDRELYDRGIAIARFTNHWSGLRELREAMREAEGLPPAPEPEKLVGTWLLASPSPDVIGRNYFGFVHTSARTSVPAVIDWLESIPEIDPRRIAIAGSSTGGFVALEAMMTEPRIAAAAVRVACGDYHDFLKYSSLGLNGNPEWLPGGELVLDPEYEADLLKREPNRFASQFPPRPLLLMNGARDLAVPFTCAIPTGNTLEAAYTAVDASDRFRWVVYGDAAHDLGPMSLNETVKWWERWLLGGAMDEPDAAVGAPTS